MRFKRFTDGIHGCDFLAVCLGLLIFRVQKRKQWEAFKVMEGSVLERFDSLVGMKVTSRAANHAISKRLRGNRPNAEYRQLHAMQPEVLEPRQ